MTLDASAVKPSCPPTMPSTLAVNAEVSVRSDDFMITDKARVDAAPAVVSIM